MNQLAASLPGLLGWLFFSPLKLPEGWHFWMLFPLVACVAVVYRATRARQPADMPKATVVTFVTTILGMSAIGAAFYALHMIVRA